MENNGLGIQDRRRPFSQMDDLIILDTDLNYKAKLAYMVLSQHADKRGTCWPSVRRVADMAGISVRSIQRGLNELVEKRYILKEERKRDNGAQTSNLYILIDLHNHPNNEKRTPPCQTDTPPMSESHTPPCQTDTPRTRLNKNYINKNNNARARKSYPQGGDNNPNHEPQTQKAVVVDSPPAEKPKPETQKTETIDLSPLVDKLKDVDINVSDSILTENIHSQKKLDTAILWVSYINDNRDDIRCAGGFLRKAIEESWTPEQQQKKLETEKRRKEREAKAERERKREEREEAKFKAWCESQPGATQREAKQYAADKLSESAYQPPTEKIREDMLRGFKKEFFRERYRQSNT